MSVPAIFFVRLEHQNKALHIGRLVETCFNRGQRLLIVVDNQEMATTLDRYLWTWKKDAFLPHAVSNSAGEPCDEPIVISTMEHNPNKAEVLVCVSPCSLSFLINFQLIYDFAETYDPQLADSARERFRLYRQQGFNPQMESSLTNT